MAENKNRTVFSWSALARKCSFKYNYIRRGKLSEKEKHRIKETIEKDASELLEKKHKLIEVEQKRANNACLGNCDTCQCIPTKQRTSLD